LNFIKDKIIHQKVLNTDILHKGVKLKVWFRYDINNLMYDYFKIYTIIFCSENKCIAEEDNEFSDTLEFDSSIFNDSRTKIEIIK